MDRSALGCVIRKYEAYEILYSILAWILNRGIDPCSNSTMKNPFVNLLKKIQHVPDALQEKILAEEMDWITHWQEWAKDEEGK